MSCSSRLAKNSAGGMPSQAASGSAPVLHRAAASASCSAASSCGKPTPCRRCALRRRARAGRAATPRAAAAAESRDSRRRGSRTASRRPSRRAEPAAAFAGCGTMRVADRVERRPLVAGEETRLARHGEALVDHPPRLLVPGRRVPLGEDVVAGIALAHRLARSISASAASPASASAVKPGGAGSGGPFSTFCDQLRQPPMLRWMP